jgi:hypothetical protein
MLIDLTADRHQRGVSDLNRIWAGSLGTRFCQPCQRHRILHSGAVWTVALATSSAAISMFCCVGKPVHESDGLAPIGPDSRTCLLFRPDGEIDDLDPRS